METTLDDDIRDQDTLDTPKELPGLSKVEDLITPMLITFFLILPVGFVYGVMVKLKLFRLNKIYRKDPRAYLPKTKKTLRRLQFLANICLGFPIIITGMLVAIKLVMTLR